MHILLLSLASPLLAAPDLNTLIVELGSPRLEARVEAERQVSAALRLSVGNGQGAGTTRSMRDGYEAALADLRTSLVHSIGVSQDRPGAAAARRRLSVILGADDRLLGLAVRLAADGRPSVRSVGEDAVLAQLNRWSRSAMSEPSGAAYDHRRQSVPWPKPLLERSAFRVALDPNGSAPDSDETGSGASAFDLLDRRGGAPIPIVLDPAFVESMARRPAPRLGAARLEGSWAELLQDLCMIHNGAFQLQGYRYPDETYPSDLVEAGAELPPARAWVHVVQRGTTQLAPAGRDLREPGSARIVAWCKGVIADGNLIRQGASARALAVLDWPAAVHWLERRWAWYGDVVALEGLLAAAARGRVAPSLQDPRCLRAIFDLVEVDATEIQVLADARAAALAPETIRNTGQAYAQAAEALDGRLQRLAVGLQNLVPMMVLPGDEVRPAASLLFEGFAEACVESQWLRLAISEGLGVESPEATAAATAILAQAQPMAEPLVQARRRPLRRQALRTLGRIRPQGTGTGAEALQVRHVGDLFAIGSAGARDLQGLGLELGRLEPLSFSQPGGFPSREILASRAALTQVLVWAALAAEQRGASGSSRGRSSERGPGPALRAAPGWAVTAVEAGLRDWRAARRPDVRDVDRSALRAAARQVRVLGGDPFRALLQWVGPSLAPADQTLFESICLQSGVLGQAGRSRAFRRSLADLGESRLGREAEEATVERAWLDLASLSADGELGPRARQVLLESLAASLSAGARGPAASSSMLVFAAERAVRTLQEARLDAQAQSFRQELRQAAQNADHPLAQRFLQVDWPPRPVAESWDLERLEPVHPPIFSFR